MTFIAGPTAVESAQRLARSALPTAPVVDDGRAAERVQPHSSRLSTALRAAARCELRIAERIDRRHYQPQPH